MGVPGRPEEGVGEAGGSSESEFSRERSSTRALRPRRARGRGARLGGGDHDHDRQDCITINDLLFKYLFSL